MSDVLPKGQGAASSRVVKAMSGWLRTDSVSEIGAKPQVQAPRQSEGETLPVLVHVPMLQLIHGV